VGASSEDPPASRIEAEPTLGDGYERVTEEVAILIFRKRDASAQVLNCKLKYRLNAFLSLLCGTLYWIA
jgi:hypothetical protein